MKKFLIADKSWAVALNFCVFFVCIPLGFFLFRILYLLFSAENAANWAQALGPVITIFAGYFFINYEHKKSEELERMRLKENAIETLDAIRIANNVFIGTLSSLGTGLWSNQSLKIEQVIKSLEYWISYLEILIKGSGGKLVVAIMGFRFQAVMLKGLCEDCLNNGSTSNSIYSHFEIDMVLSDCFTKIESILNSKIGS